jgi:hypothetical protein
MTKLVEATAIRPFQVNIPEAELTDLRRRINATPHPGGSAGSNVQKGPTEQRE